MIKGKVTGLSGDRNPLCEHVRCLPLTMASRLLSWASSGKQLSGLAGVSACHWPTSWRERKRRLGRRRERERECDSVFLCTCALSCVFVWAYSSYESLSVGATMHLRPARQMCTAWLYFKPTTTFHMVSALHTMMYCLLSFSRRWMRSVGFNDRVFYSYILFLFFLFLWPVPCSHDHPFTAAPNRSVVSMTQLTQRMICLCMVNKHECDIVRGNDCVKNGFPKCVFLYNSTISLVFITSKSISSIITYAFLQVQRWLLSIQVFLPHTGS